MSLGLAGEERVESARHRFGAPGPEQVAQLHLLIMAEAAEHRPRRRDPDAITAGAKIMGQGRDEPEAHAELFDLVITRWPPSAHERRDEHELLAEPLAHV